MGHLPTSDKGVDRGVPLAGPEGQAVSFAAAFRSTGFRVYFLGLVGAAFATEMQIVARGWLMLDVSKGSVTWLGISFAVSGMAYLTLSNVGGPLADRLDKRAILIGGDLGAAVMALLVGAGVSTGGLTPWHVLAVSVGWGTYLGLVNPTRFSVVAQLVSRETLLNAVSWSTSLQQVLRVVAPLIAGVLMGRLGIHVAYFVMAGFHLLAALAYTGMPKLLPSHTQARASFLGGAADGFQVVRSSTVLLLLLAASALGNGLGLPLQFLLGAFARQLSAGAEGFGALAAASGLGAVLGTVVTASLGDYRRKGVLLIVTTVAFGSFIVLFSASGSYWLSLALMVPVGFSQITRMVANSTLMLANTSEEKMGRVMGVYNMSMATNAFTLIPMAFLSGALGVSAVMGAAGGMMLAGGLFLALATPALRRLP